MTTAGGAKHGLVEEACEIQGSGRESWTPPLTSIGSCARYAPATCFNVSIDEESVHVPLEVVRGTSGVSGGGAFKTEGIDLPGWPSHSGMGRHFVQMGRTGTMPPCRLFSKTNLFSAYRGR